MRPTLYEASLTFRLTRACRDYIIEQAKIKSMTMTEFLRDVVQADREAQRQHVEQKPPSS
jgi:hypothetical protein